MTDARSGPADVDPGYQLRHHLAVIQAQTELLLDAAEALPDEQADALERILTACHRLDALASPTDPVPTAVSKPPAAIHHVSVVTDQPYLCTVVDELAVHHGDLVIERVELDGSIDADTDLLLLDAMFTDTTGLDRYGAITDGSIPFALVSLYSDASTPVALALSGQVDPAIDATALERALAPFVDEPATTPIAGYLTEHPDEALAARIDAHDDSTIDDAATAAAAAADDTAAPVVAISPAVYHWLSPRELGALRTVGPGRGRPVLLVAPTDADPAGRAWIPTLGSRPFLHLPPDLVGLLAQLQAHTHTPG